MKVGNIEVPGTQVGISVETAPGGIQLKRTLINQAGAVLSVKILPMPWDAVADFVEKHGKETASAAPEVVKLS